MIGIYKITSPSGKVYIGQSIDIGRRFKSYNKLKCKAQPKLYRSFKKHGVDNHTFEIIEECKFEDLNKRERFWQDEFDVLNKGLNCVLTETNEKLRQELEEVKQKRILYLKSDRNTWRGKKHTPETIKILKDKLSGENHPWFGKNHSDITKDKISKAHQGKKVNFTDEHKNNMSKAQSRDKHSQAKCVIHSELKTIYGCIQDVCNLTGIKYSTLQAWLSGKNNNPTKFLLLENYLKI